MDTNKAKQPHINQDGELENGLFCNACHHVNAPDAERCAACDTPLEHDFSALRWTLRRISVANHRPPTAQSMSQESIPTIIPMETATPIPYPQLRIEHLERIRELGKKRENPSYQDMAEGFLTKTDARFLVSVIAVFIVIALLAILFFHTIY